MALIHWFSDDIGMMFGLGKCVVPPLNKGEVIPFEILHDTPNLMKKKGTMKAKRTKEYVLWVRKILDANFIMQNTITAICTYDVPDMHYTFRLVKWNKGKLAKLDTKTHKMLTKCGFHHPHSSTHHLYLSWKNESLTR
eukprot:15346092-Ditylum_brightwellii.AAC.1